MIEFRYGVLIRGSVHMSVLLCVHQGKRETSSPSLFFISLQGNCVTSPHCFGTAFTNWSMKVNDTFHSYTAYLTLLFIFLTHKSSHLRENKHLLLLLYL